jgi:hypothetical protein
MNTTARDAIIDRMRKLSKMTTAHGCTENEANTANAMLAKLAAEWDIQQDELTLKADAQGCIRDEYLEVQTVRGEWTRVMGAIQNLFAVKVWFTARAEDVLDIGVAMQVRVVNVYGFPVDVAGALAMTTICHIAIATESESWKKANKVRRKNALLDFQAGMASRLYDRISAMKPQFKAATGSSLIVLKDQLVRNEFAQYCREHNLKLYATRSRQITNHGAFAAGQAAADRVSLNGGAHISPSRKAIGRS